MLKILTWLINSKKNKLSKKSGNYNNIEYELYCHLSEEIKQYNILTNPKKKVEKIKQNIAAMKANKRIDSYKELTQVEEYICELEKNKKTENASFTAMMIMLITAIIIGIIYTFLV